MRAIQLGPIVGVDVGRGRSIEAEDVAAPTSVWRWLLSGDWRRGPPIVSLLIRAATVRGGPRAGAAARGHRRAGAARRSTTSKSATGKPSTRRVAAGYARHDRGARRALAARSSICAADRASMTQRWPSVPARRLRADDRRCARTSTLRRKIPILPASRLSSGCGLLARQLQPEVEAAGLLRAGGVRPLGDEPRCIEGAGRLAGLAWRLPGAGRPGRRRARRTWRMEWAARAKAAVLRSDLHRCRQPRTAGRC